ncbi:MAG: hypothetical protein AAF203_07375 [Pseudomonadota bacterium]
MKKMMRLLLCLLLTACLNDGTDTGNPGLIEGDPMDGVTSSFLTQFADSICMRLGECEGGPLSGCRSDLFDQDNIDTEIGVGDLDYPTLGDINTAQVMGDLTGNTDDLITCIQDIEALSCSDSDVMNAYDPMASNPYVGVATIIPGTCSTILTN